MRVLIYNGDADLCVPYKGNEELVTNLETAGSLVEKAPWQPWYAEKGAGEGAGGLRHDLRRARQDVSIERPGCLVPHDPLGRPHGADVPTGSSPFIARSSPATSEGEAFALSVVAIAASDATPERGQHAITARREMHIAAPTKLSACVKLPERRTLVLLLREVDHALTFTLRTPLRFPTRSPKRTCRSRPARSRFSWSD